MENTQSEVYDQKVFKSLVNVIHMITEDAKYVSSISTECVTDLD